MQPFSREDLSRVIAPFGDARPLPRRAFVDQAVFDLERRIIAREWVPVAHEADLARPGDWVRAPILGEHVIVLRTADLALAAVHAVCPHRGTVLLEGERGRLVDLVIRCPYHGHAHATDGACLRAPGAPEALLRRDPATGRSQLDLERAAVASRAGVVFVRIDGANADELLREAPPWLARAKLDSLRRARVSTYEVCANWKACVGNFQESHHFASVHPGLEARTPFFASSSVIESEKWLGGLMELSEGLETVSESGRTMGRPFVAAPEDRGRVSDAFVFPLWLTSLQPDYLLTYRLAPLAVDRTLVVAEIHLHASAPVDPAAEDDLSVFWDRTNAEDRAICERQQRGLASNRAEPRYYASSEDGLHAFERLVALAYLREGETT